MQRSSELSNALEHPLSSMSGRAEKIKTVSIVPVIHSVWRSLWIRALLLLAVYCVILAMARWVALLLRFESEVPPEHLLIFRQSWLLEVGVKLLFLVLFGQLSGLLSYFSVPDLRRLFYGTAAASGVLLLIRYLSPHYYSVPRGYLLIDWLLSFGGLALLRLGFRVVRERYFSPVAPKGSRVKRVGILGAGDVGASLARELMTKRGLHLHPIAFFDDDASKWRSRVHEIPVVGAPEDLLKQELDLQLDQVIIAMPSAPAKRIGEIVRLLQRTRLRFSTVPSLDQLATGIVKVSQLRDVEIQDLLGREPVQLETESIRDLLENRVVLVTGAGGSIGSELCRQIAAFNPKRLLLIEQSEVQMFQIEQELIERGFAGIVLPLVGDVLDEARVRQILERFRPEVIFHAAAHKHVPMMELQPGEALKNNTFGTALLAELSAEYGVREFVLISTDKAINPTNVMGASKRLAEVFLQAFAAANPSRTKFIAVRFGNVLGSSGSVIPIFKKQIAAGGPVKVTHPEITRYFMTIPEAAGLVLQAATQGTGGEIFVLDMGKPVKIVDLARQLIELSGLRPDEDIEIQFTGLRPGEKLFEELSHQGENISPTTHPKIMRFVSQPVELTSVRSFLDGLRQEINTGEPDRLKLRLKEVLPEYQPYLT
jgi:FlaA1/EpsC-like NDP-sugar epimerase